MFQKLVLALIISLLPQAAMAAAAPFGMTIGTATLHDVNRELGPKTKLEIAGVNKWTNGPMLKSDGSGLGIDGLQSVYFIFTPQGKLVGVFLTLPKERYASIKNSLRSKYKLVSAQEPFVGNQLAKFQDGNVAIEASAPHMSFEMELSYTNDEFRSLRNQKMQAEATQKRQREQSTL